jgi:hypothetical protein
VLAVEEKKERSCGSEVTAKIAAAAHLLITHHPFNVLSVQRQGLRF